LNSCNSKEYRYLKGVSNNEQDKRNDTIRLNFLVDEIYAQSSPDSIIYYSDLLIKESQLLSNSLFLAKGFYYKAFGLQLSSQFVEAVDCLSACINEVTVTSESLLRACSYVQLGDIYCRLKNYKSSIVYYKLAVSDLEKLGNKQSIAGAYLNMGGSYVELDNRDSALYCILKADSLYLELNDLRGLAYAKGSVGVVFVKDGKLDLARKNLLESCELFNRQDFSQAIAVYRIWLSRIEQQSKNTQQALIYSQEGLLLSMRFNLMDQIRDSYEQLSNVYSAMGRYQEANEALKNYYAYRDSIVNTETITKIANLRTDFEVGQKQAELDAVRAQDNFKTRVAWFLAVVLLGMVVFLYIIYRHYRYGQRLAVLLKRQNHERQQQKIALEAAVAAKDRLFSVIAHDLRGPIGAMGNLVILANDAMANSEYADLQSILMMMGDSNREVENLLNSLLHWSIGQRGTYTLKVEVVDFTKLVQSVVDVYLPIAFAKGVHVSFVSQYEEHQLETDLNSWAVIVRNLVNNAVKFTHLGGVVNVSALQHPDYLELKVSDTGIGMDPEFAQQVFSSSVNQSQWGTASEKGLGIGLSLVKDFVTMNDGQIQVESQLGHGTTFTVTIPVKVLKATPFVSEMV
jgi:signal transduction histidine kinase